MIQVPSLPLKAIIPLSIVVIFMVTVFVNNQKFVKLLNKKRLSA